MQALNPINQEIDLLSHLDPKKVTIGLNPESGALEIRKRSSIPNFIKWVIYKIFCIRKPVNADLDQATLSVVQKIVNLNIQNEPITSVRKRFIDTAVKNLRVIVKNNYGTYGKQVRDLLNLEWLTMSRIQALEEVIKLIHDPKEFAQDHHAPGDYVLNVANFAEENELNFTQRESDVLLEKIKDLSPDWIQRNARSLKPKFIKYIMEKSFNEWDLRLNEEFLPLLFSALVKEPINQENLAAFVKGLPAFNDEYRPGGTYNERENANWGIGNKRKVLEPMNKLVQRFLYENKLTSEVMATIERNLTGDDIKSFIQNFFGFVAIQSLSLNDDIVENALLKRNLNFDKALDFADHLQPHNRLILLETLCQAVPIQSLVKVFYKSKAEDNIIKTILERNPSDHEDHLDTFFQDLLRALIMATFVEGEVLGHAGHTKNKQKLRELRPSIVEYILNHGSDRRKEILESSMASLALV